ncbi:GMC oxidoreductase [Amniculicola lignicola CBS 123094]|uniref:GMC oxidoreductase n=1 Tax=Amniculicola lignicola CBS 123094 TaxID=1392246 RepID=A0A6A5WQ26_9PLEO|nr:GMC oxidoreductase [Amniculicola lignicola CBS 123094]
MAASPRYDFIIVGAGPAGCMLASRLSRSKSGPSVLLLEAGEYSDTAAAKIDGERWLHRTNPNYNWGYKATPQGNLGNRAVEYDRGKGVGGTTLINFEVWDEIASLTGNEDWNWLSTRKRYQEIESYHGFEPDVAPEYRKYLGAKESDHGHKGPIKVGFPRVWERSMIDNLNIWLGEGSELNPDVNSGKPLGLGIMANSAHNGVRSSAQDALSDPPANLSIHTVAEVARVIFQDNTAVGVETVDEKSYFASKEVILCCGALDTPRVLMHSGIGPAEQLNHFNIPIVWDADQTGILAEMACSFAIGFQKSENISKSPEFASLSLETQALLKSPTLPHYEFILNCPVFDHYMDPANAVPATSVFVVNLNPQTEGAVTLQSAHPKIPLLFDPNFFAHPYDCRVVIEATREVLKAANSPAFRKDTVRDMHVPASSSDDDIWEYWKTTSASLWHMSGTARMGKGASSAVVDGNLKVFNVEGLRIADLSVYPIVISGHTQSTGYLAGLVAGDRIAKEYSLDI